MRRNIIGYIFCSLKLHCQDLCNINHYTGATLYLIYFIVDSGKQFSEQLSISECKKEMWM